MTYVCNFKTVREGKKKTLLFLQLLEKRYSISLQVLLNHRAWHSEKSFWLCNFLLWPIITTHIIVSTRTRSYVIICNHSSSNRSRQLNFLDEMYPSSAIAKSQNVAVKKNLGKEDRFKFFYGCQVLVRGVSVFQNHNNADWNNVWVWLTFYSLSGLTRT